MAQRFDAQFEYANTLLEVFDYKSARSLYENILVEEPDNARALHALGVVLHRGWGESGPAVKLIRQALSLKEEFADAYNNLAKIFMECRRVRAAIACYRKAVALEPDNHLYWINFGSAYSLAKMPEEALSAFKNAIRLAPDTLDAMLGIGRALIESKCYEDSLEYFSRAQEFAPGESSAYYGAALAYKELRQYTKARTELFKAIELKPDYSEAYRGLADVLLRLGDADASVEAARKALAIRPDFKDAHSFLLFAMHYPMSATQKEMCDEAVSWCKRFCGSIPRISNHDNDRAPQRPLRVGYISGEFHQHPVGFFIHKILASHDVMKISTYCYSNGPATDELTEQLKGLAGEWRNIAGLSDEDVCKKIKEDAIDILVDLSGHTGSNRIYVMAAKPAPVQVSWIGYYNTTGLDTIDYIIMDEHTAPVNMTQWFTERVVYLPESRFCYSPPAGSFPVEPLPALRNGYITFGSFNNISKITPVTIEIWSAILNRMPSARLLLKWPNLSDSGVNERFKAMFEQCGIDAGRVEYRDQSDYSNLLYEYGDVDITLDPFPFSGATTTCEALWMGVPVITMPGEIPASRQSRALLKVIGLNEYIARSRDDYVEIAVRHATDLEGLADLRQRLRGMMAMSALCDGKRFTAELESAYRIMWQRWFDGNNTDNDRSPINILPSVPEVAYIKGVASLEEKHWHEARQYLEHAIALNPDFPEALNNLGIVLYHLGEIESAEVSLGRSVALRPDFVEALNNNGMILTALKKEKQALSSFTRALDIDPCQHHAWNNLGDLHLKAGRFAKARACLRKAILYRPGFLMAHYNLAGLYLQYDAGKCYQLYNTLMQLYPVNADLHANMIFAMHYSERYSRDDIFSEIRCYGDRQSNKTLSGRWSRSKLSCEKEQQPLKVGFVSADFHQHPGGVFFQALARHYDRSRFFFICYDNSGKRDIITDEIKRNVNEWRYVTGTTDDELISLIQADNIDILIDLSGFTSGQRLQVFASKPAPVQVSWLGWFNTTGLKAIDYIIADPLMVQEGEERFFVEKVAYLPQVRFCYTPPFLCPDVEELPARDNGRITFGCFNNLAKITDKVVEVWAKILLRLPMSRLVLKSRFFRDYEMRRRFLRRFEVHGISSDQLELRLHSPHFFMMCEYEDIDIALDPFPFCGGLTSCESLWMGVPVITLPGELPVSRQTESFLLAVGLADCIARDEREYIDRAVEWASDLERLAATRDALRERMAESPLCDGERFAAGFGEVLKKIWRDEMVTA